MENSIVGLILAVHKRMNLLFMQMRLPVSGVTAMLIYASITISMLCVPCNNASGQVAVSGNEAKHFKAYEVYAGSIGTGVPKLARERMQQIEVLVAAEQSRLGLHYRSTVVGLEGERQICLVLPAEAKGQALLDRLHALVEGVPLLSIRAVPCSVILSDLLVDAKDSRVYEVYTSSIGTGVPELAQERMRQIEALVAAEKSRLCLHYRSTMIGLEGERRLCLGLSAKAEEQALLDRLRALVEGVPQISIRAVPCSVILSE